MKNALHKKHHIHPLWLVIPLTVWGLYLRWNFRHGFELWLDELNQIEKASRPWPDLILALRHEVQGGFLNGDHIVTWFAYQVFGHNKWGLALPHILITCVGFWLLYIICRRHFTTLAAYAVTFAIFAKNETLVRHAFEVRPYAVLTVFSLAMFAALDWMMRQKMAVPRKNAVSFGVLTAGILLYHAHSIEIIFFTTMYFIGLYARSKEFSAIFKRMAMMYGIVGLMVMPFWLFSILGSGTTFSLDVHYHTFAYIPNPARNLTGFFRTVVGNILGWKVFYPLLTAPLAVMSLSRRRWDVLGFLGILIVMPVLVLMNVEMKRQYWLLQRHFIWVMPWFAFWVGWCWDILLREWPEYRIRFRSAS